MPDIHALAKQVRDEWDRELTPAPASSVDYRMSVIAVETVLGALEAEKEPRDGERS